MLLLACLLVFQPTVLAIDPRIAKIGRFDTTNPAFVACQWPASEVRVRVKAPKLLVRMNITGQDIWQVVVDNESKGPMKTTAGDGDYTLDLGSNGFHTVELVKRTEAFVGTTRFYGFDAPEGEILRARVSDRLIEVVGDSITCGYGNEGVNEKEHFKPEHENAYMSYASIAARQLHAEAVLLAWSGRKMWPDNTMSEIYDRILPTQPEPLYDFHGPKPQSVVINLATNDFGPGDPDEAKWTGAYESFIRRIWSHYPKATVYAAIGSMMSDAWPPNRKPLTTLRTYLQHMVARVNDPRLHILEFEVQKQEDGLGGDYHPSVKTHQKMANRLAAALRRDLHW